MNASVVGDWKELQNGYAFLHEATAPVVQLTPKPDLFAFANDGYLALLIPVLAYWSYSMFFHVIDVFELAEKYRIHPPEEIAKRNMVGRWEVFAEVIFQHFIQTVVGFVFVNFDGEQVTGHEEYTMWMLKRNYLPSYIPDAAIYYGYTYGWPLLKIVAGFVIIDTWQYWLHRLMHTSQYLYKRYHSRHHRLYVPYAYGALYNAPLEGFLLDTLGTGIAMSLTRLSHREELILFTFATLKTVDDHCGYALPFDIFQWFFPNNSVYHDIHHQNFGIKTNYAQPFFTFWDSMFNTNFKGIEEYKEKQRRITLEKYKLFLKDKESKKNKKKN